jgi:chromosome segregation protein
MLLKSLELQGYKTFAGRTKFEFAGSITAIVGPNGSGKSNIADSIRWVLGEQSYRLLRGKKTDDMIFAGSELRPRAGMASATIVFDNASGWLPIDFSEVAITRRAYRDGHNEYLLNGQRVRLKDIAELLGNSGLSERSYTIIGQGLVDATLALKADERRILFEEAAGIGLYRARREEAQKRLENTARNLERVEDILAELKPRLRSLERQARRAEQYEQVKADLKVLLREYYGYHWYRAQRELQEARQNAEVQANLLEAVRQEQAALDEKLAAYRASIQSLRARLSSWLREISTLQTRRGEITRDLAVADERARALRDQQQTAGEELARLEEQIRLAAERRAEAAAEVERLEAELAEAREQTRQAREALRARQAERLRAEQALRDAQSRLTSLGNRQTRLQTRQSERAERLERTRQTLLEAAQAAEAAETALRQAETRLAQAQQAEARIADARRQAEAALTGHRAQPAALEAERKQTAEQRDAARAALARLQAQLDVLEQAEQALSGYSGGARVLLKSAQKGKLRGAKGAFSSRLEVPEEIETAVAAALGEYLDAVLVEDAPSAEHALEILAESATRGALLPLGNLTPPAPLSFPDRKGIVGTASELVRAPAELRPAVDLLLGQTLIVRDRAAARRVLPDLPAAARAVTLRGEVFFASGPVVAGVGGGASTLSRPRQRRELREQIAAAEQKIAALDARFAELSRQLEARAAEERELAEALDRARRQERAAGDALNQIRMEMERAERQAQWQRGQREKLEAEIQQGEAEAAQISESISRLEAEITEARQSLRARQSEIAELSTEEQQRQVSHWEMQSAVAERALSDARARLRERESALEEARTARDALAARAESFTADLEALQTRMTELRAQEAELAAQIERLQALIDPAEAELAETEAARDGLRDAEAKARQALTLAERRNSQAQVALTRKQERLDTLRGRIEDDFGLVEFEYAEDVSGPVPLPLGDLVEQLPMVAELPEGMGETIKRQRAQLRRMGAVNPEAQAEYQEVRQRFEFMTEQVVDLHQAQADIREVIAELDLLMEHEFRHTFETVAAEFRQIFTRLFGGGSARLVLTDPDNLTETGIDIEARLPGRRT